MIIKSRKITINRIRKPKNQNLNDELQWFFQSLGLFGNRDKNKSCFRMTIVLLKSLRDPEGLTSDEISEKVQLSRGTVVHHLHNLMSAGLVVNNRNKYMLKVDNLRELVDEIEHDLFRTMANLRDVADQIDNRLDL
ncbi:winged helix-turn-helix transcriptional regulator [archaeon]|jgi:predicted transcriptional regulator|nr:winged helix-turn-helix transcriptional regulator [archaeon]MBT4021905.1 winged helix-turn-helix transcriptional regulator [archaeon]MBT4272200.1 winged helix-turn-helix transcriptional regulator [archaeon]MBT4461722.1 winged helix-turn-helix transcriptional regulator [archaeon]MBT4858230.1 winged helix-turn-helix transcriptional regulator [archaeon]